MLLEQDGADGKLDNEEYAERLNAAMEIKLLGEARTLLIDLGSPKRLLHKPPTKADVEADVRRVGRIRRGAYVAAFGGWAALALLFNVIWLLTVMASSEPQYYWPIWPMLGLGIGATAEWATSQSQAGFGDLDPTLEPPLGTSLGLRTAARVLKVREHEGVNASFRGDAPCFVRREVSVIVRPIVGRIEPRRFTHEDVSTGSRRTHAVAIACVGGESYCPTAEFESQRRRRHRMARRETHQFRPTDDKSLTTIQWQHSALERLGHRRVHRR